MRVIFITNPCNRTKLLTKVADYENGTSKFKQLLIVEADSIDVNIIYMKYFGKEQGKSFIIKENSIEDLNDIKFT